MARTVTITTGARLHFGPLSYRPPAGRHFGGVGLMVEQPGFRLELTEASHDTVIAEPRLSDRIRKIVARMRAQTPVDHRPPYCTVRVLERISAHAGLGSGTQLGLAVARGLAELAGERDVSVATLALRAGRGKRSAVGVHGFQKGGLIVDAGQRAGEDLGALACRLPFPAGWRVMLITPVRGAAGLSGRPEERVFAQLGSMSLAMTHQLCHLIVTELLPAVQAADFDAFSEAVTDYGRRVGEFFAPIQGGIFGDARTDALAGQLRRIGVRGLGRTSWGPTLFAFVASPADGRELAQRLRMDLPAAHGGCRTQLVVPLNTGAHVSVRD